MFGRIVGSAMDPSLLNKIDEIQQHVNGVKKQQQAINTVVVYQYTS